MKSETVSTKTSGEQLTPGRRGLMRSAGLGAAGAAALTAGMGGLLASSRPALADDTGDYAILNFALNLEYLEANFYSFAAHGHGLPNFLTVAGSKPGKVIGGSAVPFKTPLLRQYANNIASDEYAHVQFLRDQLGANKVVQPELNLQGSFTTLAVAAGLVKPGQTFDPFADEISFLIGAFIFEDVGVTAYLGALSSITSKAYITAAAGIMAIEAYHAATIRALLTENGLYGVAQNIADLRAKLAGVDDGAGIKMPNGDVNIAPENKNALAFPRTTREVLNIVYGAQNASSGLFYPKGISTAS